jgi:hypoxanthine phosphoribosyltransferase
MLLNKSLLFIILILSVCTPLSVVAYNPTPATQSFFSKMASDAYVVPAGSRRREPLFIEPEGSRIGLEHFYIPEHYQDSLDSLLIPHGQILDRIEKLAYDIIQDYQGVTIHLLCVLKGGSTFFQHLSNALRKFHDYKRSAHIPFTFDFVRVKSYSGTESTGTVQISGVDLASLAGRHVIFVEDIIDTGLTMTQLLKFMHEQVAPASVRVASLLEKRTVKSCGYQADYVGFSIFDAFVVGFCLDYNEVFRDLPHIAVINANGIEKYRDADKRIDGQRAGI